MKDILRRGHKSQRQTLQTDIERHVKKGTQDKRQMDIERHVKKRTRDRETNGHGETHSKRVLNTSRFPLFVRASEFLQSCRREIVFFVRKKVLVSPKITLGFYRVYQRFETLL